MSSEEAVVEVRRIFATNTVEEAYSYLNKIAHSVGESKSTLKGLIGNCYEDIVASCERVVAVSETCTTLTELQERLESHTANDKAKQQGAGQPIEGNNEAVTRHDMLLYATQQQLIAVEGLLDARHLLEAAEGLTDAKRLLAQLTQDGSSATREMTVCDLQTTVTVYEERLLRAMRSHLVEDSVQRATQLAMHQLAQTECDMHAALDPDQASEANAARVAASDQQAQETMQELHKATMQRLRQYDTALRALALPADGLQRLLGMGEDMPLSHADPSAAVTQRKGGKRAAAEVLREVHACMLHDVRNKLDQLQPHSLAALPATLSVLHLLLSMLAEQVDNAQSLMLLAQHTASRVSEASGHAPARGQPCLSHSAQALQAVYKVQHLLHLIATYVREQYMSARPSSTGTEARSEEGQAGHAATSELTLQQLALHARRLAQSTASTIRVKDHDESETKENNSSSIAGLSADEDRTYAGPHAGRHATPQDEDDMAADRNETSVRAEQDRSALRRHYVDFMLAAVHTTDELSVVSLLPPEATETEEHSTTTLTSTPDETARVLPTTSVADWQAFLSSLQDRVVVPLLHVLLVELCTDPMMLAGYYVATMHAAACHGQDGEEEQHSGAGTPEAQHKEEEGATRLTHVRAACVFPLPIDAEAWCATVQDAVQEALRRAMQHALRYATRVHGAVVEEMAVNALLLQHRLSSTAPDTRTAATGEASKDTRAAGHGSVSACLSQTRQVCEALQLLNRMLLFASGNRNETSTTRVQDEAASKDDGTEETWQQGLLGLDMHDDDSNSSSSDDDEDDDHEMMAGKKSVADMRGGAPALRWTRPAAYTPGVQYESNADDGADSDLLGSVRTAAFRASPATLPARWYAEGGLFATRAATDTQDAVQSATMPLSETWDFDCSRSAQTASNALAAAPASTGTTTEEGGKDGDDGSNELQARREAVRLVLRELSAGLSPHSHGTSAPHGSEAATVKAAGRADEAENAAEAAGEAVTCGVRVLRRVLRQVLHMLLALERASRMLAKDKTTVQRVLQGHVAQDSLPVQEMHTSYEKWAAQALTALETRVRALEATLAVRPTNSTAETSKTAETTGAITAAHLFQLASLAELYRGTCRTPDAKATPLHDRAERLVRRCYEPWLRGLTDGYAQAVHEVYRRVLDELRAECARWPASTTSVAQLRGLYQLLHASRLRALSATTSGTNDTTPTQQALQAHKNTEEGEGGEAAAAVWYFPFQPAPRLASLLATVQHMMLSVRGLNTCRTTTTEEDDEGESEEENTQPYTSSTTAPPQAQHTGTLSARLAHVMQSDAMTDKSLTTLLTKVQDDVCGVATLCKAAHLPLLCPRLVPEVYLRLRQAGASVVRSRVLPLFTSYTIQPAANNSTNSTSGNITSGIGIGKSNVAMVRTLPCRELTELWLQLYFDLSFASGVWQSAVYNHTTRAGRTAEAATAQGTLNASQSTSGDADTQVQNTLEDVLHHIDAVDAAAVMPLLRQHSAALLCRSAAALGLSNVSAAVRERAAALLQQHNTTTTTTSNGTAPSTALTGASVSKAAMLRSSFAVQVHKEVPRFAMLPVASVSALMLPTLSGTNANTSASAGVQRMNSNPVSTSTASATLVPAYSTSMSYGGRLGLRMDHINSGGGGGGVGTGGGIGGGISSISSSAMALSQDRFSVDVLRRALNGGATRPVLGAAASTTTITSSSSSSAAAAAGGGVMGGRGQNESGTNKEEMPGAEEVAGNAAGATTGNSLWNSTQRGWSTFWRQ